MKPLSLFSRRADESHTPEQLRIPIRGLTPESAMSFTKARLQ